MSHSDQNFKAATGHSEGVITALRLGMAGLRSMVFFTVKKSQFFSVDFRLRFHEKKRVTESQIWTPKNYWNGVPSCKKPARTGIFSVHRQSGDWPLLHPVGIALHFPLFVARAAFIIGGASERYLTLTCWEKSWSTKGQNKSMQKSHSWNARVLHFSSFCKKKTFKNRLGNRIPTMNISFKLSWNSRLHHRCIQIHFSIFGVDPAVTILLAARRVTSIGHAATLWVLHRWALTKKLLHRLKIKPFLFNKSYWLTPKESEPPPLASHENTYYTRKIACNTLCILDIYSECILTVCIIYILCLYTLYMQLYVYIGCLHVCPCIFCVYIYTYYDFIQFQFWASFYLRNGSSLYSNIFQHFIDQALFGIWR